MSAMVIILYAYPKAGRRSTDPCPTSLVGNRIAPKARRKTRRPRIWRSSCRLDHIAPTRSSGIGRILSCNNVDCRRDLGWKKIEKIYVNKWININTHMYYKSDVEKICITCARYGVFENWTIVQEIQTYTYNK